DNMVCGNLSGSVVASINIRCCGGSSNVFNKALNAPLESIWISSIIYTLYFILEGGYTTLSLISLISSTLLLLAASISITSIVVSSIISTQLSHLLQGFPFSGFKQLTALENTLAADVLPVPLVPENKYA